MTIATIHPKHDQILDMWARGVRARDIVEQLGMASTRQVDCALGQARSKNDPRAVARRAYRPRTAPPPPPRSRDKAELFHMKLGLRAVTHVVTERGTTSMSCRRVNVSLPCVSILANPPAHGEQ